MAPGPPPPPRATRRHFRASAFQMNAERAQDFCKSPWIYLTQTEKGASAVKLTQ